MRAAARYSVPMQRYGYRYWVGIVGAGCALLIGGCAPSQPGATEPGTEQSAAAVTATTAPVSAGTLIDVRTPDEYAQGHLEGAINIDLGQASFDEEIAKLDKQAAYTVYCRSGNRSAQAAKRMQAAGFTQVMEAGGVEAASQIPRHPHREFLGHAIITNWVWVLPYPLGWHDPENPLTPHGDLG